MAGTMNFFRAQDEARGRTTKLVVLLVLAIVGGLPLVVKHDGTARGLAQITLTYTLGSVTVLLGFATPPRRDARLASFLDVGRTVLPAAGWSGTVRSWGADLVSPGDDLPPTRFRGATVSRSAPPSR